MRLRGNTLLGALAISGVGLVAALTVGTAVSFNLNMVRHSENVQIASRIADSALQQAIAELMEDPSFDSPIHLDGSEPGETADITFARTAGTSFSTNNGTDGPPKDGWRGSRLLPQGKVPTKRVHLVAVAHCRNVTRTREVLVYIPDYPAALASSGKIRLIRSVVGSLKSPSELAAVENDPNLVGPGDLATNAADPEAVVLEGGSWVRGNVQAGGGVKVSADSTVSGEVRPNRTDAKIPRFEPQEFDPELGNALNVQKPASGAQGSQNLVGLVKYQSSLQVDGDMKVDNSLVYVNGDLTIKGGLRGVGAVVVSGRTRIEGGSDLTTDDSVALISTGDIELFGADPSKKYEFRGMVYTRGNFSARRFTILGSFIADGQGSGGAVTLEDAFAYQTAQNAQVNFFYPRQFVLQAAGANPPEIKYLPTNPPNLIPYGNFPTHNYDQFPFITWITPRQALLHVNGQEFQDPIDNPWYWYDTVVVQIHKENGALVYQIFYNPHPIPGAASYPERFTDRDALMDRLNQISQTMCAGYNTEPGTGSGKDPHYRRSHYYPQMLAFWDRKPGTQELVDTNFSADPNRFLQNDDKIRLAGCIEY